MKTTIIIMSICMLAPATLVNADIPKCTVARPNPDAADPCIGRFAVIDNTFGERVRYCCRNWSLFVVMGGTETDADGHSQRQCYCLTHAQYCAYFWCPPQSR